MLSTLVDPHYKATLLGSFLLICICILHVALLLSIAPSFIWMQNKHLGCTSINGVRNWYLDGKRTDIGKTDCKHVMHRCVAKKKKWNRTSKLSISTIIRSRNESIYVEWKQNRCWQNKMRWKEDVEILFKVQEYFWFWINPYRRGNICKCGFLLKITEISVHNIDALKIHIVLSTKRVLCNLKQDKRIWCKIVEKPQWPQSRAWVGTGLPQNGILPITTWWAVGWKYDFFARHTLSLLFKASEMKHF